MRPSFHISPVVRVATLVCLLVCLGCEQATPQIQYVRIGLDEDNVPTILGVELRNVGAADATIVGCEVELKSTHLFAATGKTSPWPEKFEYHLELMKTPDGRIVAPGETRIAGIAFVWDLPPTAPQLIAVCKASFAIRYDASSKVETEDVMFVLASSEEARQKILGEPLSNIEDATGIAGYFESFPGKKSAGVLRVIKLLTESTEK